uniref:Uncharacterized protein n=1 Tax=Trichuris muris TaxID=70415 RepID=A0A5S6Q0S6_TRIMR
MTDGKDAGSSCVGPKPVHSRSGYLLCSPEGVLPVSLHENQLPLGRPVDGALWMSKSRPVEFAISFH